MGTRAIESARLEARVADSIGLAAACPAPKSRLAIAPARAHLGSLDHCLFLPVFLRLAGGIVARGSGGSPLPPGRRRLHSGGLPVGTWTPSGPKRAAGDRLLGNSRLCANGRGAVLCTGEASRPDLLGVDVAIGRAR